MSWRIASILGVMVVAGSFAMASGGPAEEHAEIAALRKQFHADMEPVRKKYRTRLENLQKELTRKGDLNGALAVKAELESLGAPGKSPVEKPVPKNPASLVGLWTVTYTPSGNVRKYSIMEDGRVEMVGENLFGQIIRKGDDLLLDFNDGKLERLAIKEVLFIEHFDPKTAYASEDKPRQTATAEKTKSNK